MIDRFHWRMKGGRVGLSEEYGWNIEEETCRAEFSLIFLLEAEQGGVRPHGLSQQNCFSEGEGD